MNSSKMTKMTHFPVYILFEFLFSIVNACLNYFMEFCISFGKLLEFNAILAKALLTKFAVSYMVCCVLIARSHCLKT